MAVLRPVFIVLVFGAVAIGSMVRVLAIVVSLRLRERTDRIPVAVQLLAIAGALVCCVAVLADPANLFRSSVGVMASVVAFQVAGRYSHWVEDPDDERDEIS